MVRNDPTNDERARRIKAILETHVFYGEEEPRTAVGDLLADIMHWCRINRVSFNDRLRMADVNFVSEVAEE